MIDAWASEPQYRAHVQPVLSALPESLRGRWSREGAGPVIVSSYNDLRAVKGREVIFMEHGAGQTYGSGLASYAGGPNREDVRLFLCPSERVAALNRRAYPRTPAVVVGCPRLDRWLGAPAPGLGHVGLAFHWDARVVPEARTALPHYSAALDELADRYPFIATAHPRIWPVARDFYWRSGMVHSQDSEMLFKLCDVLVVDNSSIGWEFIAMDRPVVWLNAPWYRRETEHGLRFWSSIDVAVNGPDELPDAIDAALLDGQPSARRREVAEDIYTFLDGRAAHRAAAAILERFG